MARNGDDYCRCGRYFGSKNGGTKEVSIVSSSGLLLFFASTLALSLRPTAVCDSYGRGCSRVLDVPQRKVDHDPLEN